MRTAEIPMTNGKYFVTEYGEILSVGGRKGCGHNGKMYTKKQDKNGYFIIGRIKKTDGTCHTSRVGRLVLQSFVPNTDSTMQVNHKDGNRKNDSLENLEWVTCSENIRHSFYQLNKNQKGIKNNCFKKWGVVDCSGNVFNFKDKTVDDWCLEKNVPSSLVYTSMKENRVLTKGKLQGYRFFRLGSSGL